MSITSILARLLPTRTVDKAVRGLSKFAAALEAAEVAQTDRANQLRAKAAKLSSAASTADTEAARAARVRSNIAALTA